VKRNFRQEYVTEKEKVARGRKFKKLGECRLKCREQITDEDRENIFN
jgi:hypothetical protein